MHLSEREKLTIKIIRPWTSKWIFRLFHAFESALKVGPRHFSPVCVLLAILLDSINASTTSLDNITRRGVLEASKSLSLRVTLLKLLFRSKETAFNSRREARLADQRT